MTNVPTNARNKSDSLAQTLKRRGNCLKSCTPLGAKNEEVLENKRNIQYNFVHRNAPGWTFRFSGARKNMTTLTEQKRVQFVAM